MTIMVLPRLTSPPNVAENVKAWRIFGTKPRNYRDSPVTALGQQLWVDDLPAPALALRRRGDTSPAEARAEGGNLAVAAHRLAREQPEAKESCDQRHTEDYPRIHPNVRSAVQTSDRR